jgi:hypothetical protein
MLTIFFFSLSVILLGLGIYRLKGPVSVWFLAATPYGAGNAYAPLPLGLGMFFWSITFISFTPETWRLPLFYAGGVVMFLGLLIFPRLLKPAWLRWLEREHNKIIPLLQTEIQAMGYQNWDRHINSQQDLEQWVAEVRRKHGL